MLDISKFLSPNRNGIVFSIVFKIVNDLKRLGKYNWGCIVYECFVRSLCSASLVLRNERNRRHFHDVGCVYLLQAKHHYLCFIVIDFFLYCLVMYDNLYGFAFILVMVF